MLKITTYTKQELVDLFHTTKVCNITRSLDTMGYKYRTNGRKGENYRLTILELPADAFKIFCMDELGFSANTDFRTLKRFLYFFFCDEDFQQLPIGEMERLMQKENAYITRQTIAKWIQFLKEKNIINESDSEYNYFATVVTEISTESLSITKELYLKAWRAYWNVRKTGGCHEEAFRAMHSVNGGAVFKKRMVEPNGFYSKLIDALVKTINQE